MPCAGFSCVSSWMLGVAPRPERGLAPKPAIGCDMLHIWRDKIRCDMAQIPRFFCDSSTPVRNPDVTQQVSHSTGLSWFGTAAAEEGPFMPISNVDANSLTSSEHQVQLRRAVIAST